MSTWPKQVLNNQLILWPKTFTAGGGVMLFSVGLSILPRQLQQETQQSERPLAS